MDVNFTVLSMAVAFITIGHIKNAKIWNLFAIPPFFYLMVQYSSDPLMAAGMALLMIYLVYDAFFKGE